MNGTENKYTDSHAEDEALVKGFQGGYEKAFDMIVLKYKDVIFNLCYRYLGSYEDALDASQDVFIKVYKALPRFQFTAKFFTWLYTIAANTCKNRVSSLSYKFRKFAVELDKDQEDEEGGLSSFQIGDDRNTPRLEVSRKEKADIIQKCIDKLPSDYKLLVVLRDVDGLSYEEVASVTGHKLGTVKSKLARGRGLLQDMLRRRLRDEL